MNRVNQIVSTLLAWVIAGCAIHTTTNDKDSVMPANWGPLVESKDTECVDITGMYSNKGQWVTDQGKILSNALMSQAVFSVGLPGLDVGRKVTLEAGDNKQTLIFELTGYTQLKSSYSISCESGSFILRRSEGNEYLGDGVNRELLQERFKMFRALDGSLIIHASSEGIYSTLFSKSRSNSAYSWYRFKVFEPD